MTIVCPLSSPCTVGAATATVTFFVLTVTVPPGPVPAHRDRDRDRHRYWCLYRHRCLYRCRYRCRYYTDLLQLYLYSTDFFSILLLFVPDRYSRYSTLHIELHGLGLLGWQSHGGGHVSLEPQFAAAESCRSPAATQRWCRQQPTAWSACIVIAAGDH